MAAKFVGLEGLSVEEERDLKKGLRGIVGNVGGVLIDEGVETVCDMGFVH